MAAERTDILVYAHWKGMDEPRRMGILTAQLVRGHQVWSFSYDRSWLRSQSQLLLDPDISWYSGPQYVPKEKPNFGIFLDSMPDNWGRTLMRKKAAMQAAANSEPLAALYDTDFLLGVYDPARMGALRFKRQEDGSFLDDDETLSIPPITDVRELQFAADQVESDSDSEEVRKWLQILMAPGSSLGGARPKSSVRDENHELWIAKFPSRQDDTDKGAWEYITWQLANEAGIEMAESRMEQIAGRHHTFFTKRFDREGQTRIHFASAMTMTGHFEAGIRDRSPSYLELAEFIQFNGGCIEEDLHQLWRRIVFNIAISNTDDHLRNHGFLITEDGWRISPAYDLNPSIDKNGLALNIDLDSNALDLDLAKSIGDYFQLKAKQMDVIIEEVLTVVLTWRDKAREAGISRTEIEMMRRAFMTG